MARLLASLFLASFCCPEAARADELIRQANGQESLILGVTYLREGYQSIDTDKTVVPNEVSGPQIEIGFANTRMRTLFGRPNFYTRTEVSFGLSQEDFGGDSRDPGTGAARKSNGPFNTESESMRARAGYMWEFGANRRFALIPFVGLAQQAAVRGASGLVGTGFYADFTAEMGLLGQMALTRQIVLGADASAGHTIGAWDVESRDVIGPTAVPSTYELYLDNRTFADWHQRLIVKYSDVRFGGVEASTGTLQPRRHSGLSFQLEFGTEGDLFELFFR
ncbi:MAG TPA: hypothetical protein VH278_00705 [Burkholderiaceae bacterium]|jgi:hypothetical protein|nr:hypothetical protein [Burkholderiaceae bacterium]